MKQEFYIRDKFGRERNVGRLDEDGTFVKRVQASKHYFRTGNAYGIATSVMNELERLGCKNIALYELEENQKWEVPLNVFLAKSWEHKFEGFEKQNFLARDWWTITMTNGETLQVGRELEPVVQPVKQQTLGL